MSSTVGTVLSRDRGSLRPPRARCASSRPLRKPPNPGSRTVDLAAERIDPEHTARPPFSGHAHPQPTPVPNWLRCLPEDRAEWSAAILDEKDPSRKMGTRIPFPTGPKPGQELGTRSGETAFAMPRRSRTALVDVRRPPRYALDEGTNVLRTSVTEKPMPPHGCLGKGRVMAESESRDQRV